MKRNLVVFVDWDEEAGVYVATSDDIPGLVTEHRSLDGLVDRVLAVAPELIEDNAVDLDDDDEPETQDVSVCLRTHVIAHNVAA